jgi:hypothetical protein
VEENKRSIDDHKSFHLNVFCELFQLCSGQKAATIAQNCDKTLSDKYLHQPTSLRSTPPVLGFPPQKKKHHVVQ